MFDEEGNKTYDPNNGRFFYAKPDQIMVSIHDEGEYSSIRLYTSNQTDINQLQSLVNQLRQTATRYNLSWTVRKYGHDLAPKDFAYMLTGKVNESMSFLKQILPKSSSEKS
jgi:hypothetical protein